MKVTTKSVPLALIKPSTFSNYQLPVLLERGGKAILKLSDLGVSSSWSFDWGCSAIQVSAHGRVFTHTLKHSGGGRPLESHTAQEPSKWKPLPSFSSHSLPSSLPSPPSFLSCIIVSLSEVKNLQFQLGMKGHTCGPSLGSWGRRIVKFKALLGNLVRPCPWPPPPQKKKTTTFF